MEHALVFWDVALRCWTSETGFDHSQGTLELIGLLPQRGNHRLSLSERLIAFLERFLVFSERLIALLELPLLHSKQFPKPLVFG